MRISILPTRTLTSVPLGQHAADKFLSAFVEPLKNKDVILSIVKKMDVEFNNMLNGRNSVLKKTHTFIQDFPDGKEKGDFIGIHFYHGVINMAGIKVDHSKTVQSLYETVIVPEEERLLRGTERVLFVAKAMKNFSQRLRAVEIPDIGSIWNVGVNYGYLPVEGRLGLTSFHSKSWPDEYNFTGKPVRMLNVGKQITDAAGSIAFDIVIRGFLHCSEAVFLDGVWKYDQCVGGMSLEHRFSTCIKLKTSEVDKISYKNEDKPFILLKLFWGTFGDKGEMGALLNDFDRLVDLASPIKGVNTFERIVSEEYILKLVKVVLTALSEEGHIFESDESNKEKLKEYLQEKTHGISYMSRSYSRGMWDQLIRTFRFESLSVKEAIIIGRVVEVISWRASLILALVISVYFRQASQGFNNPVFLINGTHSENEIGQIRSALEYLLKLQEDNTDLNGSIKFTTYSHVFGAAVLAAVYTKNPYDYDEDFRNMNKYI